MKGKSVEFRLYHHTDFPALYALEEACFEPLFRFPRSYMTQLLARKNVAAWIAEETRMAGFAIVSWSGPRGVLVAYIETIEVLGEFRGRGVGRELLCCLEGSASNAGGGAIGLHVDAGNTAAIHMYETHGYRYVSREENFYPLGRAALIYRKAL